MPRIVSHLILCVLAFSVYSPAQADTSSDREEFRTAYAEYQALAGEGRHEEALPAARRAYELGAALYGSQDRNTAALALNLGKSLRHAGLQEEAIDVLKDALAAYEKIYGKEAMELVDPLMELGHVMARPGQSGWQRKYYVRALRIVEDYEGADSVLYGNLNLEVGTQIMVQAQTRDCLTYLQRAYVIFSTKLGSDDVRPTLAAVQLGKYYFSIHDFDEAERFLLEALDRAEGLNESDSLTKLGVHTLLVVFYEEQGERTRASEHATAVGRALQTAPDLGYTPLYRPEPKYSKKGIRNAGAVTVEFTVDKSGMVDGPRILESDVPESLELAAMDAVALYRYAPRFVDGEPVATPGVRERVEFHAESDSPCGPTLALAKAYGRPVSPTFYVGPNWSNVDYQFMFRCRK